MPQSESYKQLIFTHHALDRMKYRSISQESIWQVLQNPDQVLDEGKPNTSKFIKTIDDRKIHVIGVLLPKEKKTLIVSVWVRGEKDKLPLVWQIITMPFKIVWWLIRRLSQKLLGKMHN